MSPLLSGTIAGRFWSFIPSSKMLLSSHESFLWATASLMPTDKSWEPFIDRVEFSVLHQQTQASPGPLQGPGGTACLQGKEDPIGHASQ